MEVARTLARATCQTVDFPRLVQRVYDDGARLFVELGPASTCTRWIGEILKQREHMVVAANQRGVDDDLALLRVLARLVSHRVELDLRPLTEPVQAAKAEQSPRKALVRKVVLGGKDLHAAIVSDEHRRLVATKVAVAVTPQPGSHAVRTAEIVHSVPRQILGNASVDHATFLTDRIATLRRMIDVPKPAPANGTPVGAPSVVWDEDDLLEFARGKISSVFGPEYAIIDSYARRVRLPMPPYLLVTRVTRLDATRGNFKPSSITTEYDIPHDAWYCVDGQIPWAVAVESGQCDLLLISYLGIDFECRGERVYRLLDCTLTFVADLPLAGQTLRYEIQINSFARSGDTLLFFFSYRCFVDDTLVLQMDGGCAGFFSDAELELGRGVVDSPAEIRARRQAIRRRFAPLLQCTRRTFDRNDLLRLGDGQVAACFGPAYDRRGLNPSLRLAPAALLMIDRIVELDPEGGAWGLGLVVAEHDLDPEHWYFPCHFKDDQVLAGSLIAEGCCQLLQFYMLFLGLQTHTSDARFQPMVDVPQIVRCRGQVTPTVGTLIYRMEVTDLGLEPRPYAKANVDIILDDKTVVRFKDLALQLSEKNPDVGPPVAVQVADRPALYSSAQIDEFARGSLTACFGEEYAVYAGRRTPRTPNGELQLISRVVAVEGRRGSITPGATLTSEYDIPGSPWFCLENSYPTTPYAILMELGLQPCGFLSAHLGSTLSDPEQDFYFRNLDGNGYLVTETDIRGKTISNHIILRSSTTLDGVIIQAFDFTLQIDGEVFFRGDASFGYFTPQALAKQAGLDSGRRTQPWYQQSEAELPGAANPLGPIDQRLYYASPGRPYERLAGGRLNFLDRALVLPRGGKLNQGYVYADCAVDPHAWFFACHFYMDPVMPGSLGVEAMLQALQLFALETGLASSFRSPRFGLVDRHQTTWKYRGQIVPETGTMALEIHVSRVERTGDQVIVVADGNLWRDGLRIYHVQELALAIKEAAPHEPTHAEP
jgi:3-hydroxymyristoyl/3-hydroxydecanoyl-(acyl carrier protein) dehydratase/malonyl CoA-acyl carrier protein transacylase